MQIYTNGDIFERTVFLSVPVEAINGTMVVKIYGGDILKAEVNQVSAENGGYSFAMPFSLVSNEAEYRIEWSFDYVEGSAIHTFKRIQYVTVVAPILETHEIREIHPNATPAEMVRIEKATRHIINAHTGQTFGRFVGVKDIRGTGNRHLVLPARLLSLKGVNGGTETNKFYRIDNGGYTLLSLPWGAPPLKADSYGYHQHVGGVIHNPNVVKLGDFSVSTTYQVDGEWGWYEVPEAVREAAKLLINDYACADNAYRDRYLSAISAADWRMQFHNKAFSQTGNVRADQLLQDYVMKNGWMVF